MGSPTDKQFLWVAFGLLFGVPWLAFMIYVSPPLERRRQAKLHREFLAELRGKTVAELRAMVLDSGYFTMEITGRLREQPAIARFLHRFTLGEYAAILDDMRTTGDLGAGFAACERAIGFASRPEILDYSITFDAVLKELRRRAMGLA
ncbi:MAG TPA: hypothetical protein VGM90_05835 [Kofleriaceae bacterium]